MRPQNLFTRSFFVSLGLTAVAAAMAGCGTSASTGATTTDGTGGATSTSTSSTGTSMVTCTEITTGTFEVAGSGDGIGRYFAPTMPNQGAAAVEGLFLEILGAEYDPANDGEKKGTFDLSLNGDDDYATCSRCLYLNVDSMVSGKFFVASKGTLVIDATSDQLNSDLEGTLTDVTLVESAFVGGSAATIPVVGGACLHLTTVTIAASVPAAWSCPTGAYGDGFCDCGCGVVDLGCVDDTVDSCDECNGGCAAGAGDCSTINPTNNAVCL